MIDYEVRFLTKSTQKIISKKDRREPILLEKLGNFKMNRKKYLNFFLKAKKIKEIYLRGLPVNNKRSWYLQEDTLRSEFIEYIKNKKIKLKIKTVTCIPNLNEISQNEFINFCKNKKLKYFEINQHWMTYKVGEYKTLAKEYVKIFNFINKNKLTLFVEPKFLHNKQYYFYPTEDKKYLWSKNITYKEGDNFFQFLKHIIRKFPNINIYVQRMGGGFFVNENFFKKKDLKRLTLITSASLSIYAWLKIFKIKEFKKFKIGFASDHPFNSYRSLKMYTTFNKFISR